MTRISVGPLSDEQRAALADLLGLARLPPVRTTVSVATLDRVLTETVGQPLSGVVARLVGPIDDRARRKVAADEDRARLWDWLATHDVVTGQPALLEWVESIRRAGLVGGSIPRTRQLVDRALRVLAELPAAGLPLPVLADRVLHDPHALDDGGRVATLVLRALASIYRVPGPVDASARRKLWEHAGVADDELSPVVLAAGLRLPGTASNPEESADQLGMELLRRCANAGAATALTLGQVRATTWPSELHGTVWVFENPSVLALALARFGRRCPPLVCTSGWPNSAGILLLRIFAAAGCELRYHGDFDGEGIRIAANVISRTGATPWRMNTADYLAALDQRPGAPGVGTVTAAPWDSELAGAMIENGVTVSEERVASGLLDELAEFAWPGDADQ